MGVIIGGVEGAYCGDIVRGNVFHGFGVTVKSAPQTKYKYMGQWENDKHSGFGEKFVKNEN